MLLVLNLPLVGLWIQLLKVPPPLLYAGILVLGTVGTYGVTRSVFDLGLRYVVGLFGFAMLLFDIPLGLVLIGLILGPLAESEFRRAMAISRGDPTIFVHGWLSCTLLAVAVLAVLGPVVASFLKSRRDAWAQPA